MNMTWGTIRILAVLLAAGTSGFGASISLKPVADTTLFETSVDNNMGADPTVVAGTTAKHLKSRALLRFDVAENIPPGSTITSVSLRFVVTKAPSFGAEESVFEVRRVLKSWGEGTKRGSTGATAGANEATWNARLAPNELWAAPGGTIGTDFASSVSSTVPVSGTGNYTFASAAGFVADVQAWVDQPASNFGWVILTQSEDTSSTARRIGSREDTANAPTLEVEYTTGGGAPLQITSIVLGDTQGTLTWSGGSPPYQPQVKQNVANATWTNLGQPVQSTTANFPRTGSQSFFRIASGAAGQ